jgi:hypothetical protein
MSEAYERKLDEFVEGKSFLRLRQAVRDRANGVCDACGSLEPRILYGLEEEGSDRCFFVGAECLRRISERGAVKRRYSRQSSRKAFEREMANRANGTACVIHGDVPTETGTSPEAVPLVDITSSSCRPQVCLWETHESYVALVSLFHRGRWVWGSGEAASYGTAWEAEGNGGMVLKRVVRDRHEAMAECVRAAADNALANTTAVTSAQEGVLSTPKNGHHDWTWFWKEIKELGLERDEVPGLLEGQMPREWLAAHPEETIEDLLGLIREKRELQGDAPVAVCAATGERAYATVHTNWQ